MAAALALAALPAAARAGPEQLDQLEPGKGEWQAEYFATLGPDEEGEHALEAMLGISDRLALGVELEGEYEGGRLAFETIAAKALYRFTDDDSPLGVGMQVQLGIDSDGSIAEAEARLLVEKQSRRLWAQGNAMLRRSSRDGAASTGLFYVWSLQAAVGGSAWLGLEGSGRSARISGDPAPAAHYLGPSLTFEIEPSAKAEVEIGLAFLLGFGGESANTGRFFVQLSF